jgi:hypothetical protein
LLVLVLQDLEEQGELSDFDGLGVDVDAVDVVEKDAFLLGGGEPPDAAGTLVDFLGVLGGAVGDVPVAVPVEEVLVGAEEEGAGTAGGGRGCGVWRRLWG